MSNLIYDKFLEELTALTKKYGLVIEGCGCGCPHLTYLHYYNKTYNCNTADEENGYGYVSGPKGESVEYTNKPKRGISPKPTYNAPEPLSFYKPKDTEVKEIKSKTGKVLATIEPKKIILAKPATSAAGIKIGKK
jgi:hypothetical protein